MKIKPTKRGLTGQLNLKSLIALGLVSTLSACGAGGTLDRSEKGNASHQGNDQTAGETPTGGEEPRAIDHLVIPPKDYYDALFADALTRVDQGLALTASEQVMWINFEGGAVVKGFGRDESFILCKASAQIPAAGLSPADQATVLQLVQSYFEAAGAKITLTTEKPTAGDFTTLHVGGAYADLGCVGSDVLGVAPFDDGNANLNDVGFAFTAGLDSLTVIAQTIAHEAGHSFGLEHVDEVKDLMFASVSSAIEGFGVGRVTGSGLVQDAPKLLQQVLGLVSGATLPTLPPSGGTPIAIPGLPNLPTTLANLPGLSQIADIGKLLPGLAGAGTAIDVSQLIPVAQALLPLAAAAVGLPGIDNVLTIVALISAAGAAQNGGQLVLPLPINQSILTTLLGQITGNAALTSLTNLAALAGYGNLTSALAAIQTLFGGTVTPPAGAIPDLAALLGIVGASAGAATDPATLIANLLGTAQVINGNFQGADKDALLSLIKLAYAQGYAQIQ